MSHVQFKGSYKGSQRKLNLNPDHVSIVFMRQDRVILRMHDGLEVPLDDDYKDADKVAKEIWGPNRSPASAPTPEPSDG